MNPDMKRLREAVIKAADAEGLAIDTYDGLPEAIVRAVLMALMDVSPEMEEGMAKGRFVKRPAPISPETDLFIRRMMTARTGFVATIDHILAEPDAP